MVNIYEELLRLHNEGKTGILITVIEKKGSGPLPAGAKMCVYPDGRTTGTIGGGALERLAVEKAAQLIAEKRSHLQRYTLVDHHTVEEGEAATGMICGGNVTLFYEYLSSGPPLYLFGGGHVGQALAYHLKRLPYYVTLIDDREGIERSFPDIQRVLIADYGSALQEETVPKGGFFVIATPDHAADYLVLRKIFASNWEPQYVGLLASRTKAARFVQDLKDELGADLDLRTLHTPVGLDIGGSSADEIAISIIAEIQSLRYSRLAHSHSIAAHQS